jgi:hypothetical protein
MREAEPERSLEASGIINIAEAGIPSGLHLRNSGGPLSLYLLQLP